MQAKKESQAKKEVKVIEPAKGPLFEEIDKENDINEDLWNDISPRKKYKSKKRVPMTERPENSLKRDLQMSVDGAYLPTPRAGNGTIWGSSKLPPRKKLLTEMLEDTKFLMDWIKSG